jgi:hypothetical protein
MLRVAPPSGAPSSEGSGKGKGGGKGKKITDFECGCCGAELEEDVPLFCLGPPVCDGDQTSCDPEGRRDLRGSRGRRDLRVSRGKGKGKSKSFVEICDEGGVTLCVDEYDQAYVGCTTPHSCGPCP